MLSRKTNAGKYRLHELDDPHAGLMGEKINEGEDVVQDLIQGLEISGFENK